MASASLVLDNIFQDLFKTPAQGLPDETLLADLDSWDSLRHIEFIASLERALKQELTFDEISALRNLGDVRRLLNEKSGS